MNSIWIAYVYFEAKAKVFKKLLQFSSVLPTLLGDTTDFVAHVDERLSIFM